MLTTAFAVETTISGKKKRISPQHNTRDHFRILDDEELDPGPFSLLSTVPSSSSSVGRDVMTRYVPAGIRYDNRILRLDPNKSQTISIDSTQLATAPAVQKITIDVDNNIIKEIFDTDSSSSSCSP